MTKSRCAAALFLTILLFFMILPFPVSANGPGPSAWYDIYVTNLPEGTVYVDLLIPLPKTDPMYTDLVEKNLPNGFSDTAEILTYSDGDFRSYTFHYVDALSVIKPRGQNMISFFMVDTEKYTEDCFRYGHKEDIEQRGEIRLAMLDKEGNILKVSPKLPLKSRKFGASEIGNFSYNAATDSWEIDTYVSGLGVIVYILLSCCGIALTCFVEWVVSCAFRLNQIYSGLILKTNLFSQIIMRLGFVLLYGIIFWKYKYVMILLEIIVYAGEYFWYRENIWGTSKKKILMFTIAANTASLILGCRLNMLLLYYQ